MPAELRHDLSPGSCCNLRAARVQLHLLEGAILKAEQDLEASWAKACFGQSSVQDAYVDEEWGSPWAAPLAQTKTKLGSFREARRRLLARMQELSLDDAEAPEDLSSGGLEEKRQPVAEKAVNVMKQLLLRNLEEQARLRSKTEELESRQAELCQSEAMWQERCRQQSFQLQQLQFMQAQQEQRFAQERREAVAQMAQLQRRSEELMRENARLKEHSHWTERPGSGFTEPAFDDGASIVSDLSSWVCVSKSEASLVLADVSFHAPCGRALQASGLEKGSLVRANGGSLLEVLEHPEEAFADEVVELWAGDVILQVVPDHAIAVADGIKKARELIAGDLVTLDGQPAALIRAEQKVMPQPVPLVKLVLSPGVPELASRRLSDESPFAAAV